MLAPTWLKPRRRSNQRHYNGEWWHCCCCAGGYGEGHGKQYGVTAAAAAAAGYTTPTLTTADGVRADVAAAVAPGLATIAPQWLQQLGPVTTAAVATVTGTVRMPLLLPLLLWQRAHDVGYSNHMRLQPRLQLL